MKLFDLFRNQKNDFNKVTKINSERKFILEKIKQIITPFKIYDKEIKESLKLSKDIGLDEYSIVFFAVEIEKLTKSKIFISELQKWKKIKDVIDYISMTGINDK